MAPQAVAAAVVSAAAKMAVNFVTGAVLTAGVKTMFVTSLVLSGVSMALQKKPKLNPPSEYGWS